MPITAPNFDADQTFGALTTLTLTDTSSGSDAGLTSRRIYLQKADGTYLVPSGTSTDYIIWAIASSSKDVVVLDKDYALDITVQWLTNTTVTYTKTILNCFRGYGLSFLNNLGRIQSSNQKLTNNSNYIDSKWTLREYIDSAAQAVAEMDDISSAQLHLNKAKTIMDNQILFY